MCAVPTISRREFAAAAVTATVSAKAIQAGSVPPGDRTESETLDASQWGAFAVMQTGRTEPLFVSVDLNGERAISRAEAFVKGYLGIAPGSLTIVQLALTAAITGQRVVRCV